MPKIRCKSCETAINVPDKALGKVIKCPKCSEKIKVPSSKPGGKSAGPAKRKKKPAPAASANDPLGLGDLDDYAMEDEEATICPYCAAEMDLEEDVVCRECGMNVETGQMDRREKKKRSRKGPDPSKFYGMVWGECWKFMLGELRLALRVGTAFTFFSTLALMCGYMGFVYVQEQMPPKVFWIGMTALCAFSVPGLIWHLSLIIIRHTRLKEKFQSDRIQFDLFTSIASGVRIIAWPIIMIPGTPLLGLLYYFYFQDDPTNPIFVGAIAAVFSVALFLWPMAMVHMTARYTYKGWIFWELLMVLFQNLAGIMYVHIIAFVALLPVAAVGGGLLFMIMGDAGVGGMNPFGSPVINGITGNITTWSLDTIGMDSDPEGMMYTLFKVPLNILAAFLIIAPIGFLAAFPGIFVMKANGMFGYYFSKSLDLIEQKKEHEPATFWVRYLSHQIDFVCSLLAIFLVTSNPKLSKIAWVFTGFVILAYIFAKAAFLPILLLWLVYSLWMYWTVQESSELQSTIGKEAFGLIVMTEDKKQLTMQQASMKWLMRVICDVLVGLPFLTAAIPPEKKALHDMMSKTVVVWKGDR